MNIEKCEDGYHLVLAGSSDPVLSEARVAADLVGNYWDQLTRLGEPMAERVAALNLYRLGIGTMHDSLRDATSKIQSPTRVMLTETQLNWLGDAARFYCEQPPNYDETYDLLARQIGRTLLLKIEENQTA